MTLDESRAACLPYSIAICTRGDDPGSLMRAVVSALAQDPRSTEVIVVDQGPLCSDAVAAVKSQMSCPPIRWLTDPGRGVARARNIALRAARNELVVFTDDDCELERGAASLLARAIADARSTAIAYGSVSSDSEVNSEGFIPTYHPSRQQILRGRRGKLRDGGIGASMALRRSAVLAVGGFDERFGPGSSGLQSCEEGELAYRLLRAGFSLAHCPQAVAIHHGRRAWDTAGRYNHGTFRSVGAAYSMYAWRGDLVAAGLLVQQLAFAVGQAVSSLVRLRRPRGAKRALGILRGSVDGMKLRPIAGSGSDGA